MKAQLFAGKVAIITGSSRGIGKAIALELAGEGCSIVLNGRDLQRLTAALEELKKLKSDTIAVCSDVASIDGSKQLIDATIAQFGRIDLLINNVGVSMRGKIADLNPEVYKTVFESNVLGTVYPTIPALPHIRKNKGSVVFISSLAAIRGLPSFSAYCASKMALQAIAESLRIEEAPHKVHIGVVHVGVTDIEHNKEAIAADGSRILLASRKDWKTSTTTEVARAVTRNIKNRRFITTMTSLGKLNKFLQPRFPWLVELIITLNLRKFYEHLK